MMPVIHFIRAFFRALIRILVGIIARTKNLLVELFTWGKLKKKMRVQVRILRDENGNPLIQPADIDAAFNNAVAIFAAEFNIELVAYRDTRAEVLDGNAPTAALDLRCNFGAFCDEFGAAGSYFAWHSAGWFGIPIRLCFPVTAFVCRSMTGKIGCSIPITDYVTLASQSGSSGVTAATTLAHEVAHSCLLAHRDSDNTNLLYPYEGRGTSTTGWQRFVARTSRHCTIW
jgi:hypothetical protein